MPSFDELLEQLRDEHKKAMADLRKQMDELSANYKDHLHKSNVRANTMHHLSTAARMTEIAKPPISKTERRTGKRRQGRRGSNLLDLDATRKELQKQMSDFMSLDEDLQPRSCGKRVFYIMENLASIYSHFFFQLLWVMIIVVTAILGLVWQWALGDEDEETEIIYHFNDMFQLIASQGLDDSIRGAAKTAVYNIGLAFGLVIFAIQVGIITESFQSLVLGINTGKSEVPEKGHTLLLGWNESTERVVCQLAFLRRQHILNNSSFLRRYLRWGRVPSSTPVAKASIVVMCCDKSKEEMHDCIKRAFADRGISAHRTRVGWDVICRVGDPTQPQDLIRVGAQNAKAIAVMLTNQDLEEEKDHHTENGATFRTVLALRQVLFSANHHPPWEDLRVVVPLSRPDKAIHSAAFSYKMEDGCMRRIMIVQDLSVFVNTLMFTCCTQPGLADVLMRLMSFDGEALRLRKVSDFPDGGSDLIGKRFKELALGYDKTVFVGVVPPQLMDAELVVPEHGLAPDGERVLEEGDRLIFLSQKSIPREAEDVPPERNLEANDYQRGEEKKRLSILVCGFRDEWKLPSAFAFQMGEISLQLGQHSKIHFLNTLSAGDSDNPGEDFVALMRRVADCDERFSTTMEVQGATKSWKFEDYVVLKHTHGDPSKYHTLEDIVVEGRFDVAIVVPPPNCLMSGQAQDTRLMGIMCLLRAICDDNEKNGLKPVHVIGENKLESTAQLALRPRSESTTVDETDFVNVQAIIARSLCQGMAYPFMQPAVVQLLSSEETSPSIYICPSAMFLPLREELTFADVIRQVKLGNPDDICLGYRIVDPADGRTETVFAPSLFYTHRFIETDVLLLVSRTQPLPLSSGVTPKQVKSAFWSSGEEATTSGDADTIGMSLLPKSDAPQESQQLGKKAVRKKKGQPTVEKE